LTVSPVYKREVFDDVVVTSSNGAAALETDSGESIITIVAMRADPTPRTRVCGLRTARAVIFIVIFLS
jgi:hypothetical protein